MEYRNAKYVTETSIECEINHVDFGWIPYGISDAETDPVGIRINTELKGNMAINGDVVAYSAPSDEVLAVGVRAERDNILATVVDPIVSNSFRWEDFTDEKRTEWTVYRQALLDIPEQSGFPSDVTWPEKPS